MDQCALWIHIRHSRHSRRCCRLGCIRLHRSHLLPARRSIHGICFHRDHLSRLRFPSAPSDLLQKSVHNPVPKNWRKNVRHRRLAASLRLNTRHNTSRIHTALRRLDTARSWILLDKNSRSSTCTISSSNSNATPNHSPNTDQILRLLRSRKSSRRNLLHTLRKTTITPTESSELFNNTATFLTEIPRPNHIKIGHR